MRQIKDLLRLKFEADFSHERIAAACKLSKRGGDQVPGTGPSGRHRLAT
jgi:hypothetical protein